jgi:TolB-like protein
VSRLRFGDFELDLAGSELRKGDRSIRLQPQPMKVLTLLADRAGRMVSRADIKKHVWLDETFVDFDQGLNYCIRQIRAALNDNADAPRFIETIPRRGYRFLAEVTAIPSPADQRVMLVVLPFKNLSGDREQEYLSDGLTEEMIAQLGRINPQRLGVIARTSAMRYQHTGKSIETIGRELGVTYALEGSVRRAGTRIRVTAQLIQVKDQTHLWADSVDRGVDDILSLQADVARAIAREVGVQLTPREQVRLASPYSVDARVFEAYLKGRYFWKKRSREALQRSIDHFNQALAIDARYAPAYAGLADVYLTQLDYNHLRPVEAFALADRALLDALRLDNSVAEPHTSLGHLRLHQFSWHAAEQQFKHALALNPGYDTAHYYYANLLAACGRFDEALAEADRAFELDPLSTTARQNRLSILYLARRYDVAAADAREAITLDPSFAPLYYQLGLVYEGRGDYDGAIDAFNKAGPEGRGFAIRAAIGCASAKAGRRDQAIGTLEQLEALSAREYVSSFDLALLQLALGNRDRAVERLSQAYDEHSSYMPFINVDPRLDDLRIDPRLQAIVQRMGFPR